MGNDVTLLDATKPSAGNPSRWTYDTSTDEVRGSKILFASATSTNEVNFDFPYNGGSKLSVNVRRHPAYGTDVYFTVSKGQMLCNSYSDCHATVRFDDRSPETFSLNEPSDNSNETVFVEGAQRFISELKKSKRMVVELEFYQGGRPQFSFDTAGLQWPPKEAK